MLWFATHRNKFKYTGSKNINKALTIASFKITLLNLNFRF